MFDKLQNIISEIFADKDHLQNNIKLNDNYAFADLLPYRSYNFENDLYYNKNSIAFILQAEPLVGADEKIIKNIVSIFGHNIKNDYTIQILNFASPDCEEIFKKRIDTVKSNKAIYHRLIKERIDYLSQFTRRPFLQIGGNNCGFVIRNFKIFLAVSINAKNIEKSKIDELINYRSAVKMTCNNIGMAVKNLEPEEFINEISALINIANTNKLNYLPHTPLNKQIISSDFKIDVLPDYLKLNDNQYEIRSLSVRNFPRIWSQPESSQLIGDFYDNMLQISCPFINCLTLTVPDKEKSNLKANLKSARAVQQIGTGITKYIPELNEQKKDWQFVRAGLKDGQILVKALYQVLIFAPEGQGESIVASVRDLYNSYGWQLCKDKYMTLQSYMAVLPFIPGEGLNKELDKIGRLKTLLSSNCANIAPLQGEWKGTKNPYLMLIGRRGQPLFWNPFENKGGNFNVAVIGKSGSGKSVLMQELVASMCAAEAKVCVIDDGYSFEHSCKLQGGNFVEFSDNNKICLNPFAVIDENSMDNLDYKTEVIVLINNMVRQMCKAVETTSDIENAFIEEAVSNVWKTAGKNGCVSLIRDYLCALPDKRAEDLGRMLFPFCRDGIYGAYFEGGNNINLDNNLTVFELSELKSKKHLQSIVMMLLMFIATEQMRKDRNINSSLVIDEAWDLLHGKSSGLFIEGIARRARKYSGNLVTGTQSMNDYYKNPAARAAIENTDWYCFLAQTPESIAYIKKNERVELNDASEKIMKSLQSVKNMYSEVYIKGAGVSSVGRLILDKFSKILYSSTGSEYVAIKNLLAQGDDLVTAIKKIANNQSGVDI